MIRAMNDPMPPSLANALLLIRHGETALNVARILQPADTPLSARGVAQAEALARRLVVMRLRAIVSSDLPRAWHTAEVIAAATGAPIETTPLLQERNFGDWRGRPCDAMPADPLTMREAPPNGESVPAFEARVAAAFAHLLLRHGALGGPIAVVTHGLVLRALLAVHATPEPGAVLPEQFGNTSLSILGAEKPHRATLLNSTTHLDAGERDDAKALSGG